MPSASPTDLGLAHEVVRPASRVGWNLQISSSVACVSALIGLKLRLPQSFVQISARISRDDRRLEARLLQRLGNTH